MLLPPVPAHGDQDKSGTLSASSFQTGARKGVHPPEDEVGAANANLNLLIFDA